MPPQAGPAGTGQERLRGAGGKGRFWPGISYGVGGGGDACVNSRLCPPTGWRDGGRGGSPGGKSRPWAVKPWEPVRVAGEEGQVSKWRPRRTAGRVRPGSREAWGHGGRTLQAHEAGVTADSARTGTASFVRAGGSLTPLPGPGPGKGGPLCQGEKTGGRGRGREAGQGGPHAAAPSGTLSPQPSTCSHWLLSSPPRAVSPGQRPPPPALPPRPPVATCLPVQLLTQATCLSLPAVSRTFHSLPSFIPRSKALYVPGVSFDGQED